MSSLKSGRMGTPVDPINNSKGCGGVMRMAPVGLAYHDAEKAFHFGCKFAAITHGHHTGYLAAGTFAALISLIISGNSLAEAIEDSSLILKSNKNHEETLRTIDNAVDMVGGNTPKPELIEGIGAGWIAEEALGISLYCALVVKDNFKNGVLLSVNHSGDSDSTGSITGNILGALHGIDIIPENWVAELELKDLIEEITEDLFDKFG